MSRSRRGGHTSREFGGSGEDSFVAVVVTKLTGALLFILLLTMIIMALLPKAVDLPSDPTPRRMEDLAVKTPETLPEAIAGRPYRLALAATGGQGPLRWSISGNLPDGLVFAPETGRIEGTPAKGTPEPVELTLSVSDGTSRATQATRLTVYQSDRPLTTPAWWKPGIPPVPWRAWLEQGFGFFVLWLVHLVGMNTISSLERWSVTSGENDSDEPSELRRFALYRAIVRLASLAAAVALALWLWRHHS
jgi:hypothetical protein